MMKLIFILLLEVFTLSLYGTESSKAIHFGNSGPNLKPFHLVVKSFRGFQRGSDYVLEVSPSLYWEKVTYYILDKNRSVLGGGVLASKTNTIVLTKYPKGEYNICIRTKDAVVTKFFVIN